MTHPRTQLWLVRHGATEWSQVGRHTSVTDLGLLPEGRLDAERMGERLAGEEFGLVVSSPRRRALETASLAGFPTPEVDPDLVEWSYGPGEGLTSAQIAQRVPGWRIWTHGAPVIEREGFQPGETREQVVERLGRCVERARAAHVEQVLIFGHGHALRVLSMLWLGTPVEMAASFPLLTRVAQRAGLGEGLASDRALEQLIRPAGRS